MRTYHYPAVQVVAEQLFQRLFPDQYRVRSLFDKKVMAYTIRWLTAQQTYLSALFSCQRAVAKAYGFHIKAGGRAGKRGDIKSCSAKNCLFFRLYVHTANIKT